MTLILNTSLFFLCVYAVATIISSEYIFYNVLEKFKSTEKLYALLSCNKCLSVWVGFFISCLGFSVVNPLVDAMCAYAITKFINTVTDLMDTITDTLDK